MQAPDLDGRDFLLLSTHGVQMRLGVSHSSRDACAAGPGTVPDILGAWSLKGFRGAAGNTMLVRNLVRVLGLQAGWTPGQGEVSDQWLFCSSLPHLETRLPRVPFTLRYQWSHRCFRCGFLVNFALRRSHSL